MEGIVKLVAAMLTARRTVHRAGVVARHGAVALALATVALVLILAAIGCAVAALWLYALPLLGPIWTAAAAALVFLILAVLLLVAARLQLRRPAASTEPPPIDAAVAGAALAELVAKHKGTALLAAVVAGVIAGTQNKR